MIDIVVNDTRHSLENVPGICRCCGCCATGSSSPARSSAAAGPVRRVHRASRRAGRTRVPDSGRRRARAARDDDRGVVAGRAASAATRVGRRGRAAMRLLPAGTTDAGGRAAEGRAAGGRRDRAGDVGQPLPLRHVCTHSPRDQACGVRRSVAEGRGRTREGGVTCATITQRMHRMATARRAGVFKQGSALLAAGIAIGFRMPDAAAAGKRASGDPHPAAGEFEPNAWVRVLPDDTIKLVVHKHDSGTGTRTALAAVVAEARRRSVPGRRDHAGRSVLRGLPASAVESVLDRRQHECRDGVRPAASSGRDRACDARRSGGASMGRARFCVHDGDGAVLHASSGRRATYGALAQAAAQLPAPKQVALKDPAQFRYIGKLRRSAAPRRRPTARFRTASTCRCRGCWSRSSRVRR